MLTMATWVHSGHSLQVLPSKLYPAFPKALTIKPISKWLQKYLVLNLVIFGRKERSRWTGQSNWQIRQTCKYWKRIIRSRNSITGRVSFRKTREKCIWRVWTRISMKRGRSILGIPISIPLSMEATIRICREWVFEIRIWMQPLQLRASPSWAMSDCLPLPWKVPGHPLIMRSSNLSKGASTPWKRWRHNRLSGTLDQSTWWMSRIRPMAIM